MIDYIDTTPAQRSHGGAFGGRNAHLNVRRARTAEQIIGSITKTVGNHDACDPEQPASMCGECAGLLAVCEAEVGE